MDEMRQFLNRVRILYCVDSGEIFEAMQSTALSSMTDAQWRRFRTDPVGFMVQADDGTQHALWSIIERRESKGREPVKAVLL